MSLLSKLFRPASDAPEPATVLDEAALMRMSCSGRMRVVGESHYQGALRAAAHGRVSVDAIRDGIPVRAVLVPEPSNKYDRNAVRVDVEGRCVGHLPRDEAPGYQRVLMRVVAEQRIPWCEARITGGGDHLYGIYLHLSEPHLLLLANDHDPTIEMVDGDRSVTVTNRDELALRTFIEALDRLRAYVCVSLSPGTVTSGKYAGAETIYVHLDGVRIGELTKGMADTYLPVFRKAFAAGRTLGAEALIDAGGKGHVSVRLPSPVGG